MTDAQFENCIRKIRRGSEEGLREIYEAYIAFIYSVVYQVLQNKENAEDVTSEFFIKLWTIADKYRYGGKHKAWLAAISRNMAIDFIRKHGKEQAVEEIEEQGDSNDSSVEEEIVSNMTIEDALRDLKAMEKEIVNLKVLGEFTFKEIAKILDMPMGTVTWQYQNAMKKLRRFGYAERL